MEKLKVKMALVLDQNFVKPLGTFCARGLPSKAAYQLGRCLKAINEANAEALALNDKQIVTYGEAVMVDDKPAKNEKGQPLFKFSEENQKIVDKERKDLMEVEVELPISEKIKLSHAKLDELKIYPTPYEMEAADHLVEFVD